METPVIFLFSGQGSQYYKMGASFFNENASFKEHIMHFDDIYRDLKGESLISLLSDDKFGPEYIKDIHYSHPAIFMLEYSVAKTVMEYGILPDFVLGESLGEFVAAAISGEINPETAFKCVVEQADIVRETCENGAMLTILGNAKMYETNEVLHMNSQLAAVNTPEHFVVSGSVAGISKIERYLLLIDTAFFRLPVNYAFHSDLINPAEEKCRESMKPLIMQSPRIKFISCCTGTFQSCFDVNFFWNVIRNPMRFLSALNCLKQYEQAVYIDMGPSGTLANFVKYDAADTQKVQIFPLLMPFGHNKNFEKLLMLRSVI